MATRKKNAAAAEEVAGLKQKSLLFFFSKPSACPPPQIALTQQALHAEEDSHGSSCSSYQQDRGDTLRWSQLLTGWSSEQGVPLPHDDNDCIAYKHGGSENPAVDYNEEQTQFPLAFFGDVKEQDDSKTQLPLSASADDKNDVDGKDDASDSTEKDSQFSLRVCKKRRMQRPRLSSLKGNKIFHTENGTYNVCKHPVIHSGAAFCESSLKCSDVAKADQLSSAVAMSKVLNDEVCQPLVPSRNGKAHCTQPKSSVEQRTPVAIQTANPSSVPSDSDSIGGHSPSKNNSKIFSTETNPVEASPAAPDVEHSSGHEETGPALNLESDLHVVEPDASVCRVMEASRLHFVDVDICCDKGEAKKASLSESEGCHGYGKFEVVEGQEIRGESGKCKLLNMKGLNDCSNVNVENVAMVPEVHKAVMDVDSKKGLVKLKRGPGHRVSALEEVCEAPITEYEREREEIICRNQHFLQNLGISSSAIAVNKESSYHSGIKLRGKVTSKIKPPVLPLRRSRRLLQDVADIQAMIGEETAETPALTATTEADVLFYDDSSVLRYTCEEGVSNSEPHRCQGLTAGVNSIVGFQPLDRILQDTYLTRVYTMSACLLSQSQRTLLAAGGHQGQIAVFGTSLPARDETRKTFTSITNGDNVSRGSGSLLSWKGSNGWISGVKFLSTHNQENTNLLISSANDGNLALWDINKQQKGQHSSARLAGLPPLKVTEARGIHSNGIFSMHELLGNVLTASKDSTVGYSKVTNQEIITERYISGHHSGAIRGVNCRDASIIADCGGDGLICILDLRMAEPCTLTIDTSDPTGVNVVEWCPSQEYLLLSASKDPLITVHDMRNVKEPLHRLSGHVNTKVQRCSQIYRPAFVANGLAIASPGQGSKALSLYSVQTGKAISRGHLGYDATMVMWSSSDNDSSSVLWVASRHISQLLPLWQS